MGAARIRPIDHEIDVHSRGEKLGLLPVIERCVSLWYLQLSPMALLNFSCMMNQLHSDEIILCVELMYFLKEKLCNGILY